MGEGEDDKGGELTSLARGLSLWIVNQGKLFRSISHLRTRKREARKRRTSISFFVSQRIQRLLQLQLDHDFPDEFLFGFLRLALLSRTQIYRRAVGCGLCLCRSGDDQSDR